MLGVPLASNFSVEMVLTDSSLNYFYSSMFMVIKISGFLFVARLKKIIDGLREYMEIRNEL